MLETNLLPYQDTWRWLSVAAWLLIGIPHGSLDFYKLFGGTTKSTIFNLIIYTLLFMAAFQLLTVIPVMAFPVLFLLSLYHFGDEAFRAYQLKIENIFNTAVVKTLWGFGIVCLLITLELDSSISVISMFLPIDVTSHLVHYPKLLFIISLVSLCTANFFLTKTIKLSLLHGSAIVFSMSLFNFFNGFTVYFTVFHAAPTLLRFRSQTRKTCHTNGREPKEKIFTAVFILTLLTLLLIYLLLVLFPQYLTRGAEVYSTALIAFLLSISLPHTLLNSKRAQSLFR